jgi:hypothetical protein
MINNPLESQVWILLVVTILLEAYLAARRWVWRCP